MKTSTGVTDSLLCAAANLNSSRRLIDQASQFSPSSPSSLLKSVDAYSSRFSETGGFESSRFVKELEQEVKSFERFEQFEAIWHKPSTLNSVTKRN